MKNTILRLTLISSIMLFFQFLFIPANAAKPWSVRMAESEMTRFPKAYMIEKAKAPRWGYCHGLVCTAIEGVWKQTNDVRFYNYIKGYADTLIQSNGKIHTYKEEEYNIDNLNAGKILFSLYKESHAGKYRMAAEILRDQMRRHPRTSEGGFWHKKKYTNQIWLDGLYMASPFLAQYALTFNEPVLYDDIANQILLVKKHHYDPGTGLFFHGWDESRTQKWADPVSGLSPGFWSRSIGWYAMAIVDVLDYLPNDHPKRKEIVAVADLLAQGIVKYQDKKSGLWYQVTDQADRKGNYFESSASSMMVYFLYKAARMGYVDDGYAKAAKKGFKGITQKLIRKNNDGTISIINCCAVAGLGGSGDHYRDGSFKYYISEPVVENDPKSTGSFILAALENEKYGK